MKHIYLNRIALVLLFVPLVFGCQSAYKVSKDTYVFKKVTHRPVEDLSTEEKAHEPAMTNKEETVASEALVSTDASAKTEPSSAKKVQRSLEAPQFVKSLSEKGLSREEAVEEYKNLSRKEKKEVKRWAKKEIKAYKKEAKKIRKGNEAEAVTRDMRTGIILGAVGLVLLLVGGGGVLGAIGAILFVVGLVFILLEVL